MSELTTFNKTLLNRIYFGISILFIDIIDKIDSKTRRNSQSGRPAKGGQAPPEAGRPTRGGQATSGGHFLCLICLKLSINKKNKI